MAQVFGSLFAVAAVPQEPAKERPAVFGSIERVAKVERARMFGPEPEPVEVQVMRYQASEEARRVIAEAFEMADQIRADAQRRGFDAGWAEGYATGKAAAEDECRAEKERFCAEYRAELTEFLSTLAERTQGVWLDAEPQIIAFVLEIARKVVKNEAAINPDVVVSVVRNALRRVVDSETVRIRVNVADLETVRNARADLLTVIDGLRNVEIVEDRRVAEGGCVLETSAGTIDAQLPTQFRMVEETLLGVRQEIEAQLRMADRGLRLETATDEAA